MWASALLIALLQTVAQPASSSEQDSQQTHPGQQIVATDSAPIRISPPTRWLLGFPGWEVSRTEASERYKLLRTLEIQVFASKYAWAEVELANTADDASPKSGWVYWGESFTAAGEDFKYDGALPASAPEK